MDIPPLPPNQVANIDNRAAECDAYLDRLIAAYREMTRVGGSAAAQFNMVAWWNNNLPIGGLAWLTDTLAVAVARLADSDTAQAIPE